MSIESAIERMNADTRDYLKDLSTAYKKTGDLKILSKILDLIQHYDRSTTESDVRSYFR